MKGVIGGTCCKYTGDTGGGPLVSSGVKLNGLGIYWLGICPEKSDSSYRLID